MCCIVPDKSPNLNSIQIKEFEDQARNAQITALVLGFISLVLITVACVLFGLGTLSADFMLGLGMLPYFAGALLSYTALGLLCGVFVMTAIHSVKSYQVEQSKNS